MQFMSYILNRFYSLAHVRWFYVTDRPRKSQWFFILLGTTDTYITHNWRTVASCLFIKRKGSWNNSDRSSRFSAYFYYACLFSKIFFFSHRCSSYVPSHSHERVQEVNDARENERQYVQFFKQRFWSCYYSAESGLRLNSNQTAKRAMENRLIYVTITDRSYRACAHCFKLR